MLVLRLQHEARCSLRPGGELCRGPARRGRAALRCPAGKHERRPLALGRWNANCADARGLDARDGPAALQLFHSTWRRDRNRKRPAHAYPQDGRDHGRLGFTRANFGVQEFDPTVQSAINRVQPLEVVARAVDGLRSAGVSVVGFDLIYGLPHQTVETLLTTIEACRAMAPDRIALFGYAHVPWLAKKQRLIPEAALPDASARAVQAHRAAETLIAAGYVAIGLDHFALPNDAMAVAAREGRLRRNFQGYTTDTAPALIGVGATAIGRTPRGYVQNIAETGAWARAIAGGALPVARGIELDDDDRLRGRVIEALMCAGRADTAALGSLFRRSPDWCTDELVQLEQFVEDGLVELDAGRVALTAEGRGLSRVVASVFDRYLGTSAARHSLAV